MSKPTNESVPWQDLVAAAKIMGIDPLPADIPLAEACEMFANAVEAWPPEKESELDPMVVVIYNDVIIFKVPVTGHADSPAVKEAAAPVVENPISESAEKEVVEAPLPETTKGKKTAAEKEAAKVAKAKAKLEEKEKKAAEKAAKKAAKAEKKKAEPGSREKSEGYAAVLRAGILANEAEGVVIQQAYEAYKAKGFPPGKDDKWALARAKRTYHYIYAQLVKDGRIAAKPKPEKPEKPAKPAKKTDETAPATPGTDVSDAPATAE